MNELKHSSHQHGTPARDSVHHEPDPYWKRAHHDWRFWGGRRLAGLLTAPLPGDGPIGEAWVLSGRDDHPSRVDAQTGQPRPLQGDAWLLPAAVGACTFQPRGRVNLLEIALPVTE
jgi:hypothetical protein